MGPVGGLILLRYVWLGVCRRGAGRSRTAVPDVPGITRISGVRSWFLPWRFATGTM